MSSIQIPTELWRRLAEVISDMGNHHPMFEGTAVGHDLDVLGSAIKYGVPPYEGATLGTHHQMLVDKAKAVTEKHGGIRAGLSPVEGFIETAEKLLGLWKDG
jgi:hypothetical protein